MTGHSIPLAIFFLGVLNLCLAQQPELCSLPSNPGHCRASKTRFFFDAVTQSCRNFTYGGCGGNDNNFQTRHACQSVCACSQPSDSGQAEQGQTCTSRGAYFFDITRGSCQSFQYSGCGGNANRFPRLQGCFRSCRTAVCYLPKVVGPCRGAHQRYFYNTATKSCERFTFGGCRGNQNNFQNLRLCETRCGRPLAALDGTGLPGRRVSQRCRLPRVTGNCRGSFRRYYYDTVSNSCRTFVYGGCRGNANNFRSLRHCARACRATNN